MAKKSAPAPIPSGPVWDLNPPNHRLPIGHGLDGVVDGDGQPLTRIKSSINNWIDPDELEALLVSTAIADGVLTDVVERWASSPPSAADSNRALAQAEKIAQTARKKILARIGSRLDDAMPYLAAYVLAFLAHRMAYPANPRIIEFSTPEKKGKGL